MTSNDEFFRSQDTPAVLKHGILSRYAPVFASAAGSKSSRVVLLDGYAGPGRYEDNSPGSPMLLMTSAAQVASFRAVECIFVERDPAHFAVLQSVIKDHRTTGVTCSTYKGELGAHLATILNHSSTAALFAFLDPFGTALSYEELTKGLLNRPKFPPTEVLLNFSMNAIRRIGGLLPKDGGDANAATGADRKTIQRLDRFLGGEWWHPIAVEADDTSDSATSGTEKIVGAYCEKVRADTAFGSFRFPVRKRPNHKPDYYLVLFSRHPYANLKFNEALSKSNVEWQNAWRKKENSKAVDKIERARQRERDAGINQLFDDETTSFAVAIEPPYNEIEESVQWIKAIEENLRSLLDQGLPFRPIDELSNVYGGTLGVAREMYVRTALKNLHAKHLCDDDGIGDFWHRLITPSKRVDG